MKILILLAYYDRPNMVRIALESIRREFLNYKNFHVAFVDDGSRVPGEPVVREVLPHLVNSHFTFYREDTFEDKIARGESIHGSTINRAIRESDADICLVLCDDDALYPNVLQSLSDWFTVNPDAQSCWGKVSIYNPLSEDPFAQEAPNYNHFLNQRNGALGCAGVVDSTQVVWRRKVNLEHDIWYPSPRTESLDMVWFSQLNDKTGLTPESGITMQYKGIHHLQLSAHAHDNQARFVDVIDRSEPYVPFYRQYIEV